MKDYKTVVAQRIKAARKRAGYGSQAELAEALGVDQSRVARWESGENLPRGRHRLRLLGALIRTEDEIFGHDDADTQETAPDILEAIERGVAQTLRSRAASPASSYEVSSEKARLIAAISQIDDGLARQIFKMIETLLLNDAKNNRRSR